MKKSRISTATFAIIAFFAFVACQSDESKELTRALEQARENRVELERVLLHYKDDHDPRKLEAAKFLIRNMQYHLTLTSPLIEKYYDRMDSISSLTPTRWSISHEQDSLFYSLEDPFDKQQTRERDIQIVKANELIHHIDDAFSQYDSSIWCRGVDFETFCEYLLPYRVASERVDFGWIAFYRAHVKERAEKAFPFCKTMQDTLYTILNRMSTNYKFNIEYQARYPYGYRPQQLYSMKRGTCQDYNILSCYMFRSVGIPMALDYVPLWGNRSLGHDCAALFVNPTVIDTNTVLDYSFSAAPKPLGQYLSSNPNLPTKVYRTTFSRQKESLADIHGKEEIPTEFESVFIKDVSAEYGLTNEVEIELDKADRDRQFYYLCSFDNKEWVPVAWTRREGSKIRFSNVGGGIVYLPCKYMRGRMKPAASPVIIYKNGETKRILPDKQHLQTLTLHRKYTEGENVRRYSRLFEGGRIEVSDEPSFRNPSVLYRFPDSIGVNYQRVRTKRPIKCRYVRFVPGEGKNGGEVADFRLLDEEGDVLAGKRIGSDGWETRHPLGAAFDENILTFARSNEDKNVWLGMDLETTRMVSEIRILPHNDDNFIREGERYQLKYWDEDHWQIIGEQSGDLRQCLRFSLCPKDALFWLHDLTRGKEERIFTYTNEKQVWW